MSPTARNRNCEDFQDDVFPIMRTQKLEASELQALYGEDRDDYCCPPADGEDQMEEDRPVSDEYEAEDSVSEFMYLAGQSSHTQLCRLTTDTQLRRKVLFSNEAYYSKLEELKRAHLKNIADLQRLYLSQLTSGQPDRRLDGQTDQTSSEQVAPKHQQNVDPNQRLIDSDQSDTCVEEECMLEQEDQPEWEKNTQFEQAHLSLPTDPLLQRKWCPFLKSSLSLSLANQQLRQPVWVEPRKQGSKVTVPQPFQMTLREEERKLRRVKTRSEVELENERLRKELDELKECGRKFRATPAPASTHLPLYEVINMRPGQWQPAKEHAAVQSYHGNRHLVEKPSPARHLQDKPSPGCRLQERPPPGHRLQEKASPARCLQNKPSPRHRLQDNHRNVPPLHQKPFSFIERERKKKEKKLQAELNNLTPREERRAFKARPVPKYLYRRNSQDFHLYGAISLHSRAQEHRPHSTAPPGGLEESLQVVEEEEMNTDEENTGSEFTPPLRGWGEKKRSAEKVEKEVERRRTGDRERDWSYIHPLRRASVSRSQEVLTASKSEYISV
ncbi:hypothetical protein SRHO_G00130390 [Serrasalmus rhombeus]